MVVIKEAADFDELFRDLWSTLVSVNDITCDLVDIYIIYEPKRRLIIKKKTETRKSADVWKSRIIQEELHSDTMLHSYNNSSSMQCSWHNIFTAIYVETM